MIDYLRTIFGEDIKQESLSRYHDKNNMCDIDRKSKMHMLNAQRCTPFSVSGAVS